MVDALNYFSQSQVSDMETLAEINEKIKVLESEKKLLSDKVKNYMIGSNIDKVDVNGTVFTLIESERRTVTKTTKDEFVANLVSQGKRHLVQTSIEPDLDSIFAEVSAGNLDKNFVNAYVKVTPVITLRCS